MELRKYWEILIRRKWVILASVILLPLFTFLIFIIAPDIYQSKAKLLIQTDNVKQMFMKNMPKQFGQITYTDPDKIMNDFEEIIQSAPVVEKAIYRLNLRDHHDRPFKMNDFIDPSIITLMLKGKGVDIKCISVSEVFEIIGYSTNASEAKKITDEVVSNFSTELAHKYREEVTEARKIQENRIAEVKNSLSNAEKAVSEFKSAHQLYNTASQIDALIAEARDLESKKDETLRSIEQAKANLKNLAEASWVNQQEFKNLQVNIENTPLIDAYKQQLMTLETNLAKLREEETLEHPDVKIMQQQINAVKENIKKEISKTVRSQITEKTTFIDNLSKGYSDSLISLVQLTAGKNIFENQIKTKQKKLSEIPEKERRLNDLTNEADAFKAAYNSMLSDLETIKSAEILDLTNALLIQPATASTHYFPPSSEGHVAYLILLAVCGLISGIFLAFLFDYLDTNLKTPEEIKKFLNQETVIMIPKAKPSELGIVEKAPSPFAESIYNFFSRLYLVEEQRTCQTISFVSTAAKSGNSTLAAHSAYTLAQGGKRVLLIDGDLRNPVIHHIFNLSADKGLSDYILNDLEIKDIIKKTFEYNLDIITSGSLHLNNPQKDLQSAKVAYLIKNVIDTYDFIFFDTPPFSSGYDALLLSALTQKAILVVRLGKTSQKAAKEFIDNLRKAKVDILGVLAR